MGSCALESGASPIAIDFSRIQRCKNPDGSGVVLGRGAYGQVGHSFKLCLGAVGGTGWPPRAYHWPSE